MNNRALEFLREALGFMQYGKYAQAETVVRLALGEVIELLDRLALHDATDHELTRRIEARSVTTSLPNGDGDGGPVLVAEAMTPARLTETPRTMLALEWGRRAALPGNGKGL